MDRYRQSKRKIKEESKNGFVKESRNVEKHNNQVNKHDKINEKPNNKKKRIKEQAVKTRKLFIIKYSKSIQCPR